MSKAGLIFRDVTLGYNRHPAVHHMTGIAAPGSLTAVVGANGSGKSTLMKGIVGLIQPMSGEIVRSDASIAYLPQQNELDRTFPARVVDLVSLGLWPRRGLLGRTSSRQRDCVLGAIATVGLNGFEKRSIDTLSGGQLQRALFARVIVQEADLILLDEPFNGIDARTVADLVRLVARWHEEGRTVMVAVHDIELVRRVFPQTILMARRPVAWGATAQALTAQNLERASRFDEAWHEDASWCEGERESESGEGPHGHPHPHRHDHVGRKNGVDAAA